MRAAAILCAGVLLASIRSETLPEALARAQAAHELAQSNHVASPKDATVSAKLAQACFELAELSAGSRVREGLAEQGTAAARFAIEKAPDLAAGYYFLALNLGETARTKSLGALSLLRQMEKALLKAVELEPQLEHAGPDRALGQLYLEAPGWPASIGNKRKAREHLERAVALDPDYPDNHLSLLEAYARWGDKGALEAGIERYRKVRPEARQKFTGAPWQQAWHDWEERWEAVVKALRQE